MTVDRLMARKCEGRGVGIDLGTTYSCVAVWQEQHCRVEIIHNDQGNFNLVINPQNTIFGNFNFTVLL